MSDMEKRRNTTGIFLISLFSRLTSLRVERRVGILYAVYAKGHFIGLLRKAVSRPIALVNSCLYIL